MTSQHLYFYGHTYRSGDKKVLSNWFQSEFIDPEDSQSYITSEQYMMAKKAALFGDTKTKKAIMVSICPKEAKNLGRKVRNFNEQIWTQNAVKIVTRGCFLKFTQNQRLKEFLLSTGDRPLVEASPYDRIWGIGISIEDASKGVSWKGRNLLGECLMTVRQLIKDGKSYNN